MDKRRNKDVRAAIKKAEETKNKKIEALATRTANNLKRLEKMRASVARKAQKEKPKTAKKRKSIAETKRDAAEVREESAEVVRLAKEAMANLRRTKRARRAPGKFED